MLLLAAQVGWADSSVAMKFAGDAMPVGSVVVFRYGIATFGYLLLLPLIGLPRLEKRDWFLVAVLGAVNFALAPTLQVESLRYTQAADVSILIGLEPLITVLLAGFSCENIWILERSRPWGWDSLVYGCSLTKVGQGTRWRAGDFGAIYYFWSHCFVRRR